jgi:quinol monooxygenase YgiN
MPSHRPARFRAFRARKGEEGTLSDALLAVADNVRANGPDTVGFFMSQDPADPCVFRTYERFTGRAAMERHNGSAAAAKFSGIAKPLLDGEVTLLTCAEISANG